MLQHVWLTCTQSAAFSRVIVATDDERIESAARGWGAFALRTSAECVSGTDRVAEVAKSLGAARRFVNVQGDEPLITAEVLRALSQATQGSDAMVTLIRPLKSAERQNPDVVKVVVSGLGNAMYFSRADIPFAREANQISLRYAHIGLYAYQRDTLLRLAKLPPTPLELSEKLEQLRALENGIAIRCVITSYEGFGIDSPDDLRRAELLLAVDNSRR